MRFRFISLWILLILVLIQPCAKTSPIHNAASNGNITKVQSLLKASPKLVNQRDKNGATPLHNAVAGNHKAMAAFLIANKANVNARNKNGATPLHIAAEQGNCEIASLLISNGADINVIDKQGRCIFLSQLGGRVVNITLSAVADDDEKISLPGSSTGVSSSAPSSLKMLELINAERKAKGLTPLTLDNRMCSIAECHSKDMNSRHFFDHTNPDGLDPFDRLSKGGISYNTSGENIAKTSSISSAHDALMRSPGHRANILNPAFHRIGIGISKSKDGYVTITQLFAN